MNNLVRVEIYKLNRNKTFWVLVGTIAGLSSLLHFLIITDWWMMSGTEFDNVGLSELNALSIFIVLLFFNLIVSTLAGFYISTDFSQNSTIKNQIISGNKRTRIFIAKFLVFSFGSILITVVIPLLTAMIIIILFGYGDIFTFSNLLYLGKAYSLFLLHFLSFTAIVLLIAIVTEDSGKTILFTLLFSIVMFAIEKLNTVRFIKKLYENTIFSQFSEVFKVTMTNGELIKSIFIGVLSLIVVILCGVVTINRKEVK